MFSAELSFRDHKDISNYLNAKIIFNFFRENKMEPWFSQDSDLFTKFVFHAPMALIIMDIALLSKMVGELILDNDQVGLPGVGTFVAELVPASFSDRGYTINPPYRRIVFHPDCLEDSLLCDFYCRANSDVDPRTARKYLNQYLAELKGVLMDRKSIVFPGLGRLRTTRDNNIFFIPEESLDIFPEGLGLEPVSLKTHLTEPLDEPVDVVLPRPVAPIELPDLEPIFDAVPAEAVKEEIPADEQETPEAAEDVAVPAEQETEALKEEAPAEVEAPAEQEVEAPAEVVEAQEEKPRASRAGLWVLLTLLIVALLAVGIFFGLAEFAPDLLDRLLYSPEELELIHFFE